MTPPPAAPATPTPPASQPAAPQPPTPQLPAPQPPAPQPPEQPSAEQPQEPQPIRPKAFKPSGSNSKLPPNLDIDNQPVSGVRKPFQQQQQPPMAQPINMAQIPPMANPPIEEQPIYRPPTMPPPQSQSDKFSSGLLWAILTLIFCCNPLAFISIILSAIANGEFKRGDIESAKKHAKISKIITFVAALISIITFVLMPTPEVTDKNGMVLPEEIEERLSDTERKKIIEVIENDMKKKTGANVKIDVRPVENE
ncbi:MAG: CD225/dispanin family protein [Victivallales bacterium]|nr:CD225/dispanin family protein [Victivallales bacterium]